jgi:hypothetical protein
MDLSDPARLSIAGGAEAHVRMNTSKLGLRDVFTSIVESSKASQVIGTCVSVTRDIVMLIVFSIPATEMEYFTMEDSAHTIFSEVSVKWQVSELP